MEAARAAYGVAAKKESGGDYKTGPGMTRKGDAFRIKGDAITTGRGSGKPGVSGVGAKRKTLTKQDVGE